MEATGIPAEIVGKKSPVSSIGYVGFPEKK